MAEEQQNDKFRKEVIGYLKKQDYGSQRFGPLKSNQEGNESLANILMDIQADGFEKTSDALGTLGKELVDNLKDLNESALMGDADSQAILLDQLKAYQSMIPLLEENNDEQREAKKRLTMLYAQSSEAMKKNSKFYNRLVEGAKSLMPAASGFLTAMTAKSPIAGAMVNFALEKFQARSARKDQAKEQAMKSLMKTFGAMSTSSSPTSPVKVPSDGGPWQNQTNDPEFQEGIEEGIVEELKLLNNQQMEELKNKLTELFDVTTEELNTIERIAQFLAPIASDEAQMEAEKQMDEQTSVLREIANGVNKNQDGSGKNGSGKNGGKGFLGGLFGDFSDWKAGLDILKAAALRLFPKVKMLGRLFSRFAIPVTLAIGIGKGLYNGVKKWMNGGTFAEALATGLTSTGDLLLDIFTFGYGDAVKQWFSEKGAFILDPIFKAYDTIVDFVSDTMTKVTDTIKTAIKTISDTIYKAKKLFDDIGDRGMDAVFDRLTGNDTSQEALDAAQAASDKAFQEEKRKKAEKAALDEQRKKDIWSPIDNTSPVAAATPELRAANAKVAAEAAVKAAPSGQGGTGIPPVAATSPMRVSDQGMIPSNTPAGFNPDFNWDSFKEKIGYAESGGKYDIVGGASNKFSGKYQMGHYALKDAGLLAMDAKDTELDDESKWLIPGGRQAFLNDPKMQEEAYSKYIGKMRGYTAAQLKKQGIDFESLPTHQQASLVASAHLTGPQTAVKQFTSGEVSYDQFGTGNNKYATLGAESQLFPTAAPKSVTQLGTSVAPGPELATDTVPRAESNMNILESATGQVKQAETASRAQVEARNSTVNVKNTNIAGTGGTGGAPTGGTAPNSPRHADPTIALFDYALV